MELTFGEYLSKVLNYHNLNQKQAASLLHISPQSLSNYILDKRMPDMNTICHIVRYFHIDANQLFYGSTNIDIQSLTDDEVELLKNYRQLDQKHKSYALAVIKNIPI